MIPSYFHVLNAEDVPRLPSGKVNRKQLTKPDFIAATIDLSNVGGMNELEKKIYIVYFSFFNNDNLKTTDDFFKDLGGHSLIASQAISMLRKENEFSNISVRDLYQNVNCNLLHSQLLKCLPVLPKRSVKTLMLVTYILKEITINSTPFPILQTQML